MKKIKPTHLTKKVEVQDFSGAFCNPSPSYMQYITLYRTDSDKRGMKLHFTNSRTGPTVAMAADLLYQSLL